MVAVERAGKAPKLPDCAGGFGYNRTIEPNASCPDCDGAGVEDIFFADTESLTGNERKLIAGVKRTRDGLELKLRDQDGALRILAQYAGMLVERKELTGANGGPLGIANFKADELSDDQLAAILNDQ